MKDFCHKKTVDITQIYSRLFTTKAETNSTMQTVYCRNMSVNNCPLTKFLSSVVIDGQVVTTMPNITVIMSAYEIKSSRIQRLCKSNSRPMHLFRSGFAFDRLLLSVHLSPFLC